MAPFFAALRKDFPSTLALHPFAEAVFFVTAAHMGLKRTFRQRSFSSIFAGWLVLAAESAHRMPLADPSELRSVFDRRSMVNVSLIQHKRLPVLMRFILIAPWIGINEKSHDRRG